MAQKGEGEPSASAANRATASSVPVTRPARASRHLVTNIRVDVAGDSASATSQILLFTGAGQLPLVGTYADRLARTPDGWRFAERRGSLDFTGE